MERKVLTAPNLVVLTGAGISRESGLSTFRDIDGVWARVRIEDVATPEAFRRDPERVNAFYNERRRGLLQPAVQPNAAHHALARLERDWPGGFLLVTQNIDDLHQRAGSRELIAMHGELLVGRCVLCGRDFRTSADLLPTDACRACGRRGVLRPDVVWFGEIPRGLDETFAALRRCRIFAAIGTSGSVYPAAQFVAEAAVAGARTVEINLQPSETTGLFDEHLRGPATESVPVWVERLLRDAGVRSGSSLPA